jgi:Uma2 family endonuclease
MIARRGSTLLEDLYAVPDNGKAEIINGRIVTISPTGGMPGRAGLTISRSLFRHEEQHGGGRVFPDNVGFVVDLPDRKSFSPDVAWYTGEKLDMEFLEGAPAFAVEVRRKTDYGPAAEIEISKKIADYFAAGALVVWDVDLVNVDTIRKFTASNRTTPIVFRKGDIADAEPAVPGWRFPVEQLIR